jgi:serine/threonine-protein kinase
MPFVCSRCHEEVAAGRFCPSCGAPAPAPAEGAPDDPYVGRTLAGKFLVNRLLGAGGMGQVYLATHLTLDRPVALKLLHPAFRADRGMAQRFHREARAASKLSHPNCIGILDFGTAEDGTLFIAMELLGGRTLAALVQQEFPLGERRVIHIVAQVLTALAAAHAAGVIHRDLNLANVMVEDRLDEHDFVKVLDFGIAKITELDVDQKLTGTGVVCGTPGYMSPEQARGDPLDARSDLYSVGIILYELLTGQLPFESRSPMGLLAKHLMETPQPPRERRPDLAISPALDALVVRTLAKNRDDRPASALELKALLLACEPGAATAAPRPVSSSATTVLDPAALQQAALESARSLPTIAVPPRSPAPAHPAATPAPPPATRRRAAVAAAVLAGVALAGASGALLARSGRAPGAPAGPGSADAPSSGAELAAAPAQVAAQVAAPPAAPPAPADDAAPRAAAAEPDAPPAEAGHRPERRVATGGKVKVKRTTAKAPSKGGHEQPQGGLFQKLFPGALGTAPTPETASAPAPAPATGAAPASGERRWRWAAGGRLGTVRVRVRHDGDALTVTIAGLGVERATLRRDGSTWRGAASLHVPCAVWRRTGLIGRTEERKVCPVPSTLVVESVGAMRIQGVVEPWGEGDLDCESCALRRPEPTPFEWAPDEDAGR